MNACSLQGETYIRVQAVMKGFGDIRKGWKEWGASRSCLTDYTACMGLRAKGRRGRDHGATETSGCEQTRGIVGLLTPLRFGINSQVNQKQRTASAPDDASLLPPSCPRAASSSILSWSYFPPRDRWLPSRRGGRKRLALRRLIGYRTTGWSVS